MTTREIFYNKEAQEKIRIGIDAVADAVRVTHGPKGRNAIITHFPPNQQRHLKNVHVTKDGVTVARSITFNDAIKNVGATLIKEVATKTADLAGDGTTTATILAQELIRYTFDTIDPKLNVYDIRKGMEVAVDVINEGLQALKIDITPDSPHLLSVATVSANNDKYIGKLVCDTYATIGNDGNISIENGVSTDTTVKIVNGYSIPAGFLNPRFITNPSSATCELDNPYIVISDEKIESLIQIAPMVQQLAVKDAQGNPRWTRPILWLVQDAEGEAAAAVVINHENKTVKGCIVRMPFIGTMKGDVLEDIAMLTGGKVIAEVLGSNIQTSDRTYVGSCDKVIISASETIIMGGHGNKEKLNERIDLVRGAMEKAENENDKSIYRQRLACLSSSFAVISVGGITETEQQEKKDRIDDAVRACKAALMEGITSGGGVAYLNAMDFPTKPLALNDGQKAGYNAVMNAVQRPILQLCENAGHPTPTDILNIVRTNSKVGYGYNVKDDVWGDMVEMGITDPVMVVRMALENAVSVVATVITSSCLIINSQV